MRYRLEDASDLLILNFDTFSKRTESFFKTLNESKAHRLLFLEDPVDVLQKMVFPERAVARFRIDDANRLLFAILSNPAFMKWADQYQRKIEAEAVKATKIKDKSEALRVMTALFDKRKLYEDVAEGIVTSMDVETILGVMYGVGGGGPWRRPPPIDDRRSPGRDRPPWLMDGAVVFVEATAILLIHAVITFCVFIGRELPTVPGKGGLSRTDLRRISATLAKEIREKAIAVRQSGALSPHRRGSSEET